LICRTEFDELPPRVEYTISAYGESLRPLIEAVRVWGRAHLERGQPTASVKPFSATQALLNRRD
jgi:DNA-binding HxlR family transcriptional regulator